MQMKLIILLNLLFTGNEIIAQILIDNQAEIDARNNDQQTAMHFAALNGNENTIKILIDNKANINAKDENDYAPIHFAVERGELLFSFETKSLN